MRTSGFAHMRYIYLCSVFDFIAFEGEPGTPSTAFAFAGLFDFFFLLLEDDFTEDCSQVLWLLRAKSSRLLRGMVCVCVYACVCRLVAFLCGTRYGTS